VSVGLTGRNVIANLFGGIWTALMSLLFIPLYLRFLGPEALGFSGVLAALQAVFGLLDFGLGATFNREMARLSASGSDGTQERELTRTAELMYWALGAVIAAVVALFAPVIVHRWVHVQHLPATEVMHSVMLMGVVIACQFPFSIYQAGLLGRQRQVLLNVITIAVTTLRTAGAVLLLWRVAASIELFFAWQAFMMVVQVVATRVALWRDLPRTEAKIHIRPALIRGLWAFSAALGGNAILGVLLTQTDKMLLSGMLPLSQFGYYTLAGSVAAVLWYVINPVGTAFYPRFTALLHSGDEGAAVGTYHRACQMMAMLLLPIAATVAAFSYQIIFVWTRSSALAQATAVTAALLIVGTTLNGLAHLPVLLGVAAGFPLVITITNLIAVCVIVPAIFFATRRFGIQGAAAVWVLQNSFYVFIAVPLAHSRVLRGEKKRWYVDDFVKPAVMAAACAAIARLLIPENMSTAGTILYVGASGLLIAFATAMVLPHVRSLSKTLIAHRELHSITPPQ
jgi:O-antigen/teichoic acid export membrane protein